MERAGHNAVVRAGLGEHGKVHIENGQVDAHRDTHHYQHAGHKVQEHLEIRVLFVRQQAPIGLRQDGKTKQVGQDAHMLYTVNQKTALD